MRATVLLAGLFLLGAVAAAEVDLRPRGRAVVRAETAALLLSDQQGGAVRLAVLAVPLATPGDVNVTLLIEIDGTSLVAGHDAPSLWTDVFVYAMSSGREVLATAAHRFVLDLGRHRERLAGAGLRVVVGLVLPPGDHDLRVLVRAETGALGLAGVPVAVPEADEEAVLPPLQPSPPDWITAATAKDEAVLAAAWTARGMPEPWRLSGLPAAAADEALAVLLPPATEAVRAEALRRAEIAAAYAAVLRRLAAGDQDAALIALYELESRVLPGPDAAALGELERAQAETLKAVAKSSPAALLPVVLLHADAVRGYRAAGRSSLVAHSETVVTGLTRSYAERAGSAAARCDAVRVLAGLAAEMQRLGTLGRAEELYRRALEIDPGHAGVALALAAVYEWLGRYAAAAKTLESIAQPGPEARLRLAVNLLRTRRRGDGERLLRRLMREAEEDWARLVAVEELAKLELARGAPQAAADLLRRALAGSGRHPTLELQMAFALDQLERREEAAALIAGVARGGSRRGAGERARYNEWPPVALEACPALPERAAAGRAELARALAPRAGGRR